MSYSQLAYLHLGTIFPAFILGSYLITVKKGTKSHQLIGKIYMLLMLLTALITLFMPAQIGERVFDHFGWIHGFSLLVFYSVPSAFFAIKNGNLRRHKYNMIGLYVGGILIAGSFTLMPGRLLHEWIF
ncbi:MAG: DUF2306 domain-containing protein [Candidatus Thioglobus sp.]|uniref:DUF2306 domain-containing protein n=1 Tax=Candidatus Thioglobus sp. TaxID=2026721 RepID=UPI002603CD05|nr:DUF2306 domain-containing protein [Candidatus Thioglobus sp.]MDC9726935.1 DUF2306 domain-containing protein [Candidatus Thioglobus sp.]